MAFEKPTKEQLANRYGLHAQTMTRMRRGECIRRLVLELAEQIVADTPCSPEQARALNALDEVMFLANAAIARNE